MLLGFATSVFALAALQLMHEFGNQPNTVQFDPIRLVEAKTAGIALLAAGLVVYTRGDVKALTHWRKPLAVRRSGSYARRRPQAG